MKRYRTPKAKPGQLVAAWGRVDRHNDPSIVYAYPDRDGKCDSRVLCDFFEEPRLVPSFTEGKGYTFRKSLAEELEARGYDLETLKFTISKKAVPEKSGGS